MHDADNFSKNTELFQKMMEKREDYMTMHLPRIFANKADDLLGVLLFPHRNKEDEDAEQ